MKKILHVSCSPRGAAAESYWLSRQILALLRRAAPSTTVINRDIGCLMPHIDGDYAISQSSSTDVSSAGSMAHSEMLVQELEGADFVIIGTPMHNFTIPSTLKAWIDHVVRARRTFNITPEGKVGALHDRPVFIAISSGGNFSGAQARQPDFLVPYLRYVLGIIGLRNLTFFSVEGTAAKPHDVAKSRKQAEAAIRKHLEGIFLKPLV